MERATLDMIVSGHAPKGDVFAVARIRRHHGRQAHEQSDSPVPSAEPDALQVDLEPVDFTEHGGRCGVRVSAACAVRDKTA